MYSDNIVILRARKGVPGVGRKLARAFNAYEVTCGFRPNKKVPDGALVLNYGRSEWPIWFHDAIERGVKILNSPSAVSVCVNKLTTLRVLSTHGIPTLEFTDDKAVAAQWSDVIVRSVLNGKQGKGVERYLGSSVASLPEAPLYTKFYDKTHEFRVHVVNGEVIDLVQKKRLGSKKRAERGIEEVDDLVRNHKKGWVFAHQDLICDAGGGRDELESMAVAACSAIGLDFGGVDVLARYTETGVFRDAVVCEVNSAPGMSSPTTFKRYVKAFSKLL